jgi:hypothetical protein
LVHAWRGRVRRERLRAQRLTLVEVLASDPDHQPAKRNGEDDG